MNTTQVPPLLVQPGPGVMDGADQWFGGNCWMSMLIPWSLSSWPRVLYLSQSLTMLAPTRAFSLLKVSTSAFTLKNLLRHYTRLIKHGITRRHESLSANIIKDGAYCLNRFLFVKALSTRENALVPCPSTMKTSRRFVDSSNVDSVITLAMAPGPLSPRGAAGVE